MPRRKRWCGIFSKRFVELLVPTPSSLARRELAIEPLLESGHAQADRSRPRLMESLLLLAAAQGVFAGSMLTEGAVLVPHWRSLSPAEFFAYYRANDRRLFRWFAAATAAAALATWAAAALAWATSHSERGLIAFAALLSLVYVAMFPLYFARANASFSAASVPEARLPEELARWHQLHWLRSAIAAAAFGALLLALD